MKILLTSAGRRPYLVRWFQEALIARRISGDVIVADSDSTAPSQAFTNKFIRAPRLEESTYNEWLEGVVSKHGIDMAISLNDFELSFWSKLPQLTQWTSLVRLTAQTQAIVEDKYETSQLLTKFGVLSPNTWLGTSHEDVPKHNDYVTKGRYGSASRGLRFTTGEALARNLLVASGEVTTRTGFPALHDDGQNPKELVVIQERIRGTEYGLDIVSDLNGEYAGVLARKKLSMRSGETDRAITVDPGRFDEIASKIASAVPHQGTIDVDVIVDNEGRQYVIDINPRFGGGYPFSHVAGADIPSAYVGWKLGRETDPEWFSYRTGVTAGKYIDIAAIDVEGAY